MSTDSRARIDADVNFKRKWADGKLWIWISPSVFQRSESVFDDDGVRISVDDVIPDEQARRRLVEQTSLLVGVKVSLDDTPPDDVDRRYDTVFNWKESDDYVPATDRAARTLGDVVSDIVRSTVTRQIDQIPRRPTETPSVIFFPRSGVDVKTKTIAVSSALQTRDAFSSMLRDLEKPDSAGYRRVIALAESIGMNATSLREYLDPLRTEAQSFLIRNDVSYVRVDQLITMYAASVAVGDVHVKTLMLTATSKAMIDDRRYRNGAWTFNVCLDVHRHAFFGEAQAATIENVGLRSDSREKKYSGFVFAASDASTFSDVYSHVKYAVFIPREILSLPHYGITTLKPDLSDDWTITFDETTLSVSTSDRTDKVQTMIIVNSDMRSHVIGLVIDSSRGNWDMDGPLDSPEDLMPPVEMMLRTFSYILNNNTPTIGPYGFTNLPVTHNALAGSLLTRLNAFLRADEPVPVKLKVSALIVVATILSPINHFVTFPIGVDLNGIKEIKQEISDLKSELKSRTVRTSRILTFFINVSRSVRISALAGLLGQLIGQ
jgi:hypothetical protein